MKHINIAILLALMLVMGVGDGFGQGSFTVTHWKPIGDAIYNKSDSVYFIVGDTLIISPAGIYYDPDTVVSRALVDSIVNGYGRFGAAGGAVWVEVGNADTVTAVGTSDTLMTLADTGNYTSIETQNVSGFLFLEQTKFQQNVFIDDGSGDSPILRLRDEDNQDFSITKYDAGYTQIWNTEGEIRFHVPDLNDYIFFDTVVTDVPRISTAGGCDLVINASSGEISLGDENLTTTGTLDAGATSVTGNITVTGTVDGVDVLALNTGVAADSATWRSSDADSLVGIDIQTKTGNLQNNYLLKVDISGADTTLQWEADASGATSLEDVFNYMHPDVFDTTGFNDSIGIKANGITDAMVTDALTVTGYMQDGDINTFAKLQSWVSDKTLVNEEDAATIDVGWTFAGSLTADSINTDHLVSGSTYLGNDTLKGIDVLVVDTVVVDGDVIKDFTGTNLSVTAGVLNATGGGALTYWTESDDNDTSVFTATAPNTTVGLNDNLTMQGNDITGVANLTVVTGITVPNNSISDEELDEGANFTWTGNHIFRTNTYFDDEVGDSPSLIFQDGDNQYFTINKDDDGFSYFYNVEGAHRFYASDDDDDYIYFDTFAANVPMIATGGDCDLVLNPSGGYVIAIGDIATGDTTTGDVDVYHYFSIDGSWTTRYLVWNDGDARFEFNDELLATHLYASGWGQAYNSWRIGDATGPATPSLYFFDGGTTTGEYLRFDTVDANDKFELSNDIDITGDITLSGTVDGKDVSTLTDIGQTVEYDEITATTSANWAGLVSDETGTGKWVFATSPTFTGKIVADSGFFGTIALQTGDTGILNVGTANPGRLDGGECDAHFGDSVAGKIELGNSLLGQSSDTTFNGGLLDLNQTAFWANMGSPAGIEFAFFEANGDGRFVIPTSGAGYATNAVRSFMCAGPWVWHDSAVIGTYWGFDALAMATGTDGADLGVQNNLQVLDTIFFDSGAQRDTITATEVGEFKAAYDSSQNLEGNYLAKDGGTMAGSITSTGYPLILDTIILGDDTMSADHIPAYLVRLQLHNATGITLAQGLPVYISGATGDIPNADSARADNAIYMPTIGLVEHDIANGADGYAVVSGKVEGLNTNGLSEGDAVYVAPTGGWTTTKPTGTDLIQNIGQISRVNPANGDIYVSGAGRVNDLPNLPDSHFWVGNASAVATAVDMTGDVTMSNAGVTSIANDVIAPAEMADADHGDVSWSSGVASVEGGVADSAVVAADAVNADTAAHAHWPADSADIANKSYVDSKGIQDSTTQSLFVSGTIEGTGEPVWWNHRHTLDYTTAYAVNATTIETLPTPTGGDVVCSVANEGLHPSILYTPKGALGTRWQEWMMWTTGESCTENPNLIVRTNGNPWTEFYRGPDSGAYGEGYGDSTFTNPLYDTSDFADITYLSDPDIFGTADGKIGMVFRATDQVADPDSHLIKVSLTSDGLTWSDTTILWGSMDSASDLMSPSVLLDTSGTYKLWAVERNGGDENTVILFESAYPESGWVFVGTTDLWAHDTSLTDIWHIDVSQRGPDEYVALVYECQNNANGGGFLEESGNIHMATSPNGLTGWTIGAAPVITHDTGSGTWYESYLYRATGYWRHTGKDDDMVMYYSAFTNDSSFGHRYHIGRTIVGFPSNEIAHGTNPIVDAVGEYAWDSDDGGPIGYDSVVDATVFMPFREHMQALITAPDNINDSVEFIYVDSLMYPFGIEIEKCYIKLPGDAAYSMEFMVYSNAAPSVFGSWIDTVTTTGSDDYMSTIVFTDSILTVGERIFIGIPATDVDWVKVGVVFWIKAGD